VEAGRDIKVDCSTLEALLDLEDVDDELLVEGEGATQESTGSDRGEVREEKDEDTVDSLCRCTTTLGLDDN